MTEAWEGRTCVVLWQFADAAVAVAVSSSW